MVFDMVGTFIGLAVASFVCLVGSVIWAVIEYNKNKSRSGLLLTTIGVLLALALLRCGTTYTRSQKYRDLNKNDKCDLFEYGLERWSEDGIDEVGEMISDSILSSLQAFTLDADYQANVDGVKSAVKIVAFEMHETDPSNFARIASVVYVIVLNILAPIVGGSILFVVFAELFPQIRFFFKRFSGKKLYIFSELNERSVASAESIMNAWKKTPKTVRTLLKPSLIFTDIYPDDEDEKRSELINKAKSIGAVCLKDDVRHIGMKKDRPDEIFLIDEDEFENVRVLADLVNKDVSLLNNKVFRVFYNDDSYVMTAKKIMTILREKYKVKYPRQPEEDEKAWEKRISAIFPRIERERCYSKMVCAHLTDVPLFSIMTDRLSGDHSEKEKKEINLTIVGNGKIGMETLLTSYWMGQCDAFRLAVNMVSPDTLEDAVAKIDRINPEILRTSWRYDDLLVKYEKGGVPHYNPTYFTFRYCSSELSDATAENMTFTEYVRPGSNAVKSTLKLTDSDYYLIAAGSDEENISVAETVKRWFYISNIGSKVPKRCIISYVVYDDGLCETLNRETAGSADPDGFERSGNCYVKMIAMGNLGSIFDYGYSLTADDGNGAKSKKTDNGPEGREKTADIRHQPFSDTGFAAISKPYEMWAQNARRYHSVYRKFSAFCFLKPQTETETSDSDGAPLTRYLTFDEWCAGTEYKDAVSKDMREHNTELGDMLEWVEHRRWNAYIRSIGYRFFGKETSTCKHMEFRLHNCLVEEMRIGEDEAKTVDENENTVFVKDRLDEVMELNGQPKLKGYDRPDIKYDE